MTSNTPCPPEKLISNDKLSYVSVYLEMENEGNVIKIICSNLPKTLTSNCSSLAPAEFSATHE